MGAAGVAVRETVSDARVLEAVLRGLDQGVLLTDLDHRSLACNRRFGELFGIAPGDVVRLDPSELRRRVLPIIDNAREWLATLEIAYENPEATYQDELVLRRNRAPTVLRRFTGPARDAEGRVFGRLWTFQDVTREARLRRMQEILVEASTFWHSDPTEVYRAVLQRISDFYDRSTVLLSIRREDFMEFKTVVGPLSPLRFLKGNNLKDSYCQFALRSVRPVVIQNARDDEEYRNCKPLRLGYSRYLGVPLRGDENEPIGTLCFIDNKSPQALDEDDVRFMSLMASRIDAELARERHTQTRIAEKEHAIESQRRDLAATQSVLEAMNDAFELLAEGGSTEQLVREQAKLLRGLLGYSAATIVRPRGDAFVGVRAERRVSQETLPMDDARVVRVLNARPLELVFEAGTVGCRLGNERETLALVLLEGGGPSHLDDPRHRIHLEAIMEQVYLLLATHLLQRELIVAHRELEATHEQLLQSEKLSVVGTLAASTAHDIRNILASLSILVAPGGDPERALAAVREQIDRFGVLAHRLMSYARPQSLSRQTVELRDVLDRVITLVGAQARICGVEVEVEGRGTVPGDPHQLEHLFVNLALNAIQAMDREGGTLRFDVATKGEIVTVRVSDTGPGLPKGAKLFEPFATTRATGTGLGLFSCRRIAEEHGGRISATNNRNRGSTFTVELPRKAP